MEQLNDLLRKIPIVPIAILYCLYLGYGYYDWKNAPTSEYFRKKNELKTTKDTLQTQKNKLKEAQEFIAKLETQKANIAQLTSQLESAKVLFGQEIDVASYIRTISTEAKKINVSIKNIKPEAEVAKEFYVEVPFTIGIRGAFVQFLVLFDRLSRMQQISRISSFNFKPSNSAATKFTEIEGDLKLVTYKYKGSEADKIKTKADHGT